MIIIQIQFRFEHFMDKDQKPENISDEDATLLLSFSPVSPLKPFPWIWTLQVTYGDYNFKDFKPALTWKNTFLIVILYV